MSVGVGLLYSIIANDLQISILENNHIARESFIKDELKIFDFILSHLDRYQNLPSWQTVMEETKTPLSQFPQEPIEYWVEQVHARNDSNDILSTIDNMQILLRSGDVQAARDAVQSLYDQLQKDRIAKNTTTLKEMAPKVVDLHDRRQLSGKMSGIPFGFPYIDSISDGAQKGDTIAIVGRPSTGKTYILFKMILEAYAANYMPLVISMEMNALQCARRMLALYANVPATSIRFGTLSYWGRQKLLAGTDRLPDDFLFPIIDGSLIMTIENIGDKIREVRPDAVYIDGGYLPHTRNKTISRWERVTEVAEIIKRYAGKFNIPIFATYQFNRKGPGLSNIGLSDAIAQLSSIVFSISDENALSASAPKGIFYKTLSMLKGREGERGKIIVVYNMIRMLIEQYEVVENFSSDTD